MDDYDKIKFGALLHDVGKFSFRTHQEIKHELAGEIFNQQYIPEDISNELIGIINPESVWGRNNTPFSFVKVGDWLASAERTKLSVKEIEQEEMENAREVIKKPLKSIFCNLFLNKNKDNPNKIYFPHWLELESGEETDSIIPQSVPEDKEEIIRRYKRDLWKKFIDDINSLNSVYDGIKDNYFHSLLYTFKKHFTFIPSAAWVDVPDVSLYDHIKTSCAISCSLYKELQNDGKKILDIKEGLSNRFLKKESESDLLEEEHFSLIHGDLSGIQKFIYTISTEHALKTLKGRSAFLVLLNELLALHVLNKLELPITNILFSGGGHFYILAPRSALDKLQDIREEINRLLLNEFEGKLYLAIAGVPLNYVDFDKERFSNKWEDVSKETAEFKRKKFKELFDDDFFTPKEVTKEIGKAKNCSICNKELPFEKGYIWYMDEKGVFKDYDEGVDISNEIRYCRYCKSFVEFSRYLKDLSTKKEPKLLFSKIKEIFNTSLFDNLTIKDKQFEFYLNSTEEVPFKFFPLGIPVEDGKIIDFGQLAQKAKGTKKLAILKMDVDNLGKIFTFGLGKNKTISRVSTLSSMMSLFFEGYINTIINKKDYKDKIYLIYAGGDDTLAVGTWNDIIEFAKDIYLNFRKFTCCDKDVTLSAAIVFMDAHYPISRAAEEVEEELSKAKHSGKDEYDKNRISILGEVFKWDYFEDNFNKFKNKLKGINKSGLKAFEDLNEFQLVYYLYKYLADLIGKEYVSSGFLHRIMLAVKGFDRILKDSLTGEADVPRIWRLKYHIVRNYENKDCYDEVLGISNFIDIVVKHNLENRNKENEKIKNVNMFSVAARLAEMETRNE
jgi:CRISPR-associated protein Csm1